MTCAPCTYSPEQAVYSSPTSSSDTRQLQLLSGNPTPAKSCVNAPQTDGSPACTCTRETSGCSIHPNTPAEWIASMRASLARICRTLETRQDSAKAQEAVFTAKCSESLAWYDPATCSCKTSQRSFLEDWAPFSETWPRAGMTAGGVAWKHRESERHIDGTGGGCSQAWQTPVADDAVDWAAGKWNSRGEPKLSAQVKMWPTPTAMMNTGGAALCKWGGSGARAQLRKMVTPQELNGALNPTWVEKLMGWPLGWTVSRHWATGKSRSRRQSPGCCSEGQ